MIDQDALSIAVAQATAQNNQLLLALSGGLDSTVLLHLLVALRQTRTEIQLRAVYIHHGLSVHADEWAQHCQAICQRWQVPFQLIKVNVESSAKGIEAGARAARYTAFSQILQSGEALLTAQHLDDQCETFFLALKRGSGPAGLSSMAERSPFKQGVLVRPLLSISREQIERYAHSHRLSWIEDESNQDPRYDRNFLRLSILPELSQRWPHFSHAVARSASLCAEQELLLDELLAEQLVLLMDGSGALAIEPLKSMSEVKRWALLRRWLDFYARPMPSKEQLRRLWQDVAISQQDAEPCLRLGDYDIRRFRQRLYLVEAKMALRDRVVEWPDFTAHGLILSDGLILPDGLGQLTVATVGEKNAGEENHCDGAVLRFPTADERVTIRFTATGNIRIVGRDRSRSLKKLWQEFDIPPWLRGRTPLVFFGEKLIVAVGVFVTPEGLSRESGKGWRIRWQKNKRIAE